MDIDIGRLDQQIPLQDASYGELADANIHVPLRYAAFQALTKKGTSVSLADPRQFLGWSRCSGEKHFFFSVGKDILCIHIRPESVEPIRAVRSWSRPERCVAIRREVPEVRRLGLSTERVTTVDGGLLYFSSAAAAADRSTRSIRAISTRIGLMQARPSPVA